MFRWLAANISTLVIGLVLAAIVAAIVLKLVRDKKAGRSSCGCGCSACAMSEHCRKS